MAGEYLNSSPRPSSKPTLDRLDSAGIPPREVIGAALAHVVQNRVEAAYRRSDLFERRRRLMDDWAAYLAGESCDSEAGPIR